MNRYQAKAKEIFKARFITDWMGEDPEGTRREMFIGNLITEIAAALLDAANQMNERAAKVAELHVYDNEYDDGDCDNLSSQIATEIRALKGA